MLKNENTKMMQIECQKSKNSIDIYEWRCCFLFAYFEPFSFEINNARFPSKSSNIFHTISLFKVDLLYAQIDLKQFYTYQLIQNSFITGMKTPTALVLILMACFVACQPPEDLPYQAWKNKHGLEYSGSVDAYRQMVFNENMVFIKANNKNPNRQVTLGPNQFTALTFQEFSAAFLTFKQTITANQQGPGNQLSASAGNGGGSGGNGGEVFGVDVRSVDWKAQGKVTPVKNQGSCGSCVPFSVAASIESSFLIKNSQTLDLSEQQLVDCVTGNSGCNGGRYQYAFRYVASNQMGITTEVEYPYQAKNLGSCSVNGGSFKIDSYVISTKGDCQALRDLVFNNGPASVAVAADRNFQSYSSGVLRKCGTQLNHAVLLTGFDTEKWHVKNSWGTGWGQQGYIYLKAGASTCGICNDGGHRATAL